MLFELLNIRKNKTGYITACIVSSSIFTSIWAVNTFFNQHLIIFTWATIIALLTSLSRVGHTKLAQVFYGIEHCIYTLIIIDIMAIMLVLVEKYAIIFLGLLIFISFLIPRIRQGATSIGAYLTVYTVIVWSFYSQHAFQANDVYTYIKYQSIGVLIGVTTCLIYTLILPLTPVIPAEKNANAYLFIRAARVAIAMMSTLMIASFFQLYNPSWICFSALVVMQQSLGLSIERSIHRLIGTILGIVVGVALVHLLGYSAWQIAFSSFGFIFLGSLFIQKNYALGLFFFTLLLIDVFYFLTPTNVTIDQYMLDRLLDTFIGISIAMACELLIFPKTFLRAYKVILSKIHNNINHFFNGLLKKSSTDKLKKITINIEQQLNQLNIYTHDVRYEPFVLLSKRYKYAKKIPVLLQKLLKEFNFLIENKESLEYIENKKNHDLFKLLANIFKALKLSREKTDAENLIFLQKKLAELALINKAGLQDTNLNISIKLIQYTEEILKLYECIYATNRYYLKWK